MDAIILINSFFENLFGKEKLFDFENKLILNESKMTCVKQFIFFCIIEGIIIMVFTMLLLFYINFNVDKAIFLGLLIFFVPFLINYLFQDIIFERRKQKKELLLPELLLEVSVFFDENSIIKNFEKISKMEIELLNKDFEKIYLLVSNGEDIINAINKVKTMNQSKTISRVYDLFIHAYQSGANMSEIFRDSANDLMENNAIIRERQAVMLITKYTLILSSAFIVPCILGLIIGLVSGLNIGLISEIELGLSKEARVELFNLAVLGTNLYIIEFAILSSYFLAIQEGNKKNFWIYSIVILPISITCFLLTQSM